MLYDQNVIDNVREANNIVEVINEYLPLKRSGANYKCKCPFHNEKTPSFMVSSSKQIFKCFGCGKGGNVFNFLMEYEKISFTESVKKLAERAGINLPQKNISKEKLSLYNELFQIQKVSLDFYRNNLKNLGKEALEYLHNRKITDDVIKKFKIGLALGGKNRLSKFLHDKGFSNKSILESGLFTQKGNNLFDKFFQRIMFPIFSPDGKVIAFSSRIFKKGDERGAKYLNSPENKIFKKRNSLYGLYQTKNEIIKKDSVILVEGNMDLIILYQYGFTNIVASLGTALTFEQIKLLARYTENIYILFDGDEAGFKACNRAIKICLRSGIFPKIVILPQGHDPDSFIKENCTEDLQNKINKSVSFYEFIYEYYNANKDIEEKKKAVDELIDDLIDIKDPVKRELYITKSAEYYNIDPNNIIGSINLRKKKFWHRNAYPVIDRKLNIDEREIIKNILNFPEKVKDFLPLLEPDCFRNSMCKELIELINKQGDKIGFISNISKLLDNLNSNTRDFVSDLIFSNKEFSRSVFQKLIDGIQVKKLESDLNKLNTYIIEHPNDIHKIREKESVQKKIRHLKEKTKGGSVRKIFR